MATPYTATTNPAWQPEMRSVTPAMTNTRGYNGRYASAPRMGGGVEQSQQTQPSETYRSMTPNRYMSTYQGDGGEEHLRTTPSSTGLIRLSLKKPMGIVFEPMYDPHKPSDQRGVRICDLPRTGAAALSRKLQVGDELLQINDTTVSRLTFDEIMDFIIEADPENVNLLFRRPRKETLQARQGVQQKLNAAANKDAPNTVKWVDEEHKEKKKEKREKKKEKKEKITSKRTKKESTSEEEETLQSSTADGDSYEKAKPRTKKKTRSRRNPVETESFLDMLIDSICSDSSNVCRDTFRRNDDEYGTDDDESFGTEVNDEETYATYEESVEQQRGAKKSHKKHHDEERPTHEDKADKHRRQKSHHKEKPALPEITPDDKKKYEDDGTLETVETSERPKEEPENPQPIVPLGLAPIPPPSPPPQPLRAGQSDTDDDGNPAPIRELEYDDRIDHGADVSVMESLGGPSLLIEKQRAAQAAAQKVGQKVPVEIMEKFGLDYIPNFGMTREQTIEADPLKYYTFVVRRLLEDHEPEKVRLLDKLLAKYKGREDHLVQKLSVRYNKTSENVGAIPEEEHDEAAFSDAVKKNKSSAAAAQAVSSAKELLQNASPTREIHRVDEWPEKETKEQDEGDDESESESEYSRESIDGTSPAVIAQVSELLNYVYGKTSVPGQIDRVSTIMRAYEGREAVLLELLETKALIKANKEKENADNLPSFLRNSQIESSQNNDDQETGIENQDLPPVTPMATQPQGGTVINDDISSMSGVSSPAAERGHTAASQQHYNQEMVGGHGLLSLSKERKDLAAIKEKSRINPTSSTLSSSKPPVTPDKRKKKGLFGGLFGGKKKQQQHTESTAVVRTPGSIGGIGRKIKGVKSVEGSI